MCRGAGGPTFVSTGRFAYIYTMAKKNVLLGKKIEVRQKAALIVVCVAPICPATFGVFFVRELDDGFCTILHTPQNVADPVH